MVGSGLGIISLIFGDVAESVMHLQQDQAVFFMLFRTGRDALLTMRLGRKRSTARESPRKKIMKNMPRDWH